MPHPTPVTQSPTVLAARDRLDRLRERRAELDAELIEARTTAEPTAEDLAERAFGGEAATITADPDTRKIAREIEGTDLAIRRAESAFRSARRDAMEKAVERRRPHYRGVQRDLARRVRDLLKVAEAEREIVAELRAAGVETSVRVGDFHPLPTAQLTQWLERAERDFT